MKELILDLISAYENGISTVEELIITTYQATAAFEGNFDNFDEERDQLRTSLQEVLAKNCSLRKKDFNHLMAGVLADFKRKKMEIDTERERIITEIKGYLAEQKELAGSLRQQLIESVVENGADGSFDCLLADVKITYQTRGQQLLTTLGEFQRHLGVFCREQEGINHKLQGLVQRGESLRIEDLRRLDAVMTRRDRKMGKEWRRREVEELLA